MSAGQLVLGLLSAVLKAGLLLALAALLTRSLKRAPARARHGIWAAALAGALLLPLLSPWVPRWSVDALPIPELAAERPASVAAASEAVGESRRVAADQGAAASARQASSGLGAGRAAELAANASPDAAADLAAGPVASPVASPIAGPTASPAAGLAAGPAIARISPAAWLLGLWLAGCAVSLAWLLRALGAARRLERGAVACGGSWRHELERARRLVGLRRPVRLLLSPAVVTPMTWGVLAPVILLPARAAGWSAERRHIVLLHELVHARRADWLVRLLGRVACSIYWPNPLAWIAARRLAVEQEMACDEEVVALGARPSSYAGHLLAIARSMGPATAAPAHALDMARRSQMEGRLMSILDERRRLPGGRKLAVLALLLVAGLVPALAAIEPWVDDQRYGEPGSGEPEYGEPAAGGEPAVVLPSSETEGVARVLAELQGLALKMEPFEAELEGLEAEMQPIERELEGLEVEMEPVEVELEGFEVELEPFEARLEAVTADMRPFEERLAAVEVEMGPFEERLAAIDVELEPLEREMEALSERMEPLAESGRGGAELERLAEQVRQVHERMKPLHERMAAIQEAMRPVYERMSAAHQEMEPLHERMAAIHEEMEPVYESMGEAHERMGPHHERMAAEHARMEPFHRKMGEVHERMRPLHEEMGRRHEELERELAVLVERMLARELAEVTAPNTDYGTVAARVVDALSLRVDDGTLRVMSSAPELREILDGALAGRVTAPEPRLSAAVDRFVRALGDLEIEAR